MTKEKAPVQCTGAFFYHFGELNVIWVGVSFAFAEVLLHFSLKLFSATLDVLTSVVGGITHIAANLAFHLFGGAFDLVLETAIVKVLHFNPPLWKSESFPVATLITQAICPPLRLFF